MSLLTELKRRNVIKVALFYAVGSWLIIQVAETVLPLFEVPDSLLRGLVILLAIAFLPVLVFSWIYEMTPEGIKRESEIKPDQSVTRHTGRRLNGAIVTLLVLAVGLLGYQQMVSHPGPAEGAVRSAGGDKSIAVLPFADLSPAGDQAFFADGIAEELLNTLVRVPHLKVAARTSSFQFKGNNRDISGIGSQLGVATVLEGSVRKSGDRVRITAQLIKVADGFHLWSQTFDESLVDLLDLQTRIARQIANALSIQLDSLQPVRGGGPVKPAAFEALVRGRQAFAERHLDDNRRTGVEQFQLATQIDPNYADAWAHFAYALSISGAQGIGYRDAADKRQRMRAADERALALAPEHPLAMVVRGKLQVESFHFQAGLDTLNKLTRAYPSFVEGQYALAQALQQTGASGAALAGMRRVLALDPLNLTRKRVYAEMLLYSGQADAAFKVIQDYVALGGRLDLAGRMFNFQMLAKRHGDWRAVRAAALRAAEALPAEVFPAEARAANIEYHQVLSTLLKSADPAPLRAFFSRHGQTLDDAAFALTYLWEEPNAEAAIAAVAGMIAKENLLDSSDNWFLTPAFKLDDGVRNRPSYVALWQSPEMREFARVRIANGALQAIPQSIIDEIRSQ